MLLMATAIMLCVCDLGVKFDDKAAWKEPPEEFIASHAVDGFVFASSKRDVINCLYRGGSSWRGMEAYESRIYYGADGVERVEISLYNKGDDRSGVPMGEDDLNAMLKAIAVKIDPEGNIGKPEHKKLKTGGYSYVRRWQNLEPCVELSWGLSGNTSKTRYVEYVRLVLSPKNSAKGSASSIKSSASSDSRAKVKANVAKNSAGDVWIRDVPMVDQGSKGYCAVATAERIMRYYGIAVDEHELAHMAKSSADKGTSVSHMIETVKIVGSKHRLGYSEIVKMSLTPDDMIKDVKAYNRAARAAKAQQISIDDFVSGRAIDAKGIREAMNPEILRQMRIKDGRYRKFLSEVRAQIDKGVPVFWGVMLGWYQEPDIPQASGGHMRLIIGYNAERREIIYTDSWGAGHELKRMPEDWAFSITRSAFYLKPL